MWYFSRKSDNKEFMLVSASLNRTSGESWINGVSNDGEKCSLPDGDWDSLIKK